jgi:hypothetical protein
MIFTNGEQRIFYRTMLGVAGMIMQQLTGINLITYVCQRSLIYAS